ncbi:hypothetical protein C8Q74DRAFT_693650 [Fomes fomentarius]|nr:hypothetical protein C8Q74DRAFT_693650 [Fomes fomentarius]
MATWSGNVSQLILSMFARVSSGPCCSNIGLEAAGGSTPINVPRPANAIIARDLESKIAASMQTVKVNPVQSAAHDHRHRRKHINPPLPHHGRPGIDRLG